MARAYDHVLKPIIESIEKDNLPPWRKCWDGGIQIRPKNHSGTPYKGGNVISLWVASMIHGFTSPYWFTFNQGVKTNGWALKPNDDPKKAEAGRKQNAKGLIIYYGTGKKQDRTKEKEDVYKFAKYSNVFNAEQFEDIPEKYLVKPEPPIKNPDIRDREIDEWVEGVGPEIFYGGERACFIPTMDKINMPEFEKFVNANYFYSTLFHEMTHWTGHKKRLEREFGKRFGDKRYAMEELVAELGAAFLCADHGIIFSDERKDHASYLKHWLEMMKEDSQVLFTAASKAEAAAAYMHEQISPELSIAG